MTMQMSTKVFISMLLHSQQHHCHPIALRICKATTETLNNDIAVWTLTNCNVLQYVSRSANQRDGVSSGVVHRDRDKEAVL